jgi:tRNA pseudouridine38-40 synthase
MGTTPPWPASSSSEGHRAQPHPDPRPQPPADQAVNEDPTIRIKLLLSYEGSGFHGFAAQPGLRTVAGVLTEALGRHLRHPVELVCAGRTDRGVHAWGQVVSFEARADVDTEALLRGINRSLGPAVAIRDCAVVEPGFDARRWATGRRYRYCVLNRAVPDPFLAPTSWHVPKPLDLAAMRLACDPLYGEHDFSSFCRRPPTQGTQEASLVRRVRFADWFDLGEGLLRFEIEAGSFCHQMVRAMVGTMVDMGTGRRKAGEMSAILRARDRSRAGQPAPPHGLCLWEVTY